MKYRSLIFSRAAKNCLNNAGKQNVSVSNAQTAAGQAAKPDKKLILTIVVQGTPYTDSFNVNMPLRAIAEKAREKTNNTGRPLTDWKLTDQSGRVLSFDIKLEDAGIPNNATLFLDLKDGGGG